MKYVLIGDGQSPHLIKWARALAPWVTLYVCSSRGFSAEWTALVPKQRQMAFNHRPSFQGGNIGQLKNVHRLGQWLREIDADWLNPHYLTSHGALALLAKSSFRLRARVLSSAWGSDILIAPQKNVLYKTLTRAILKHSDLCTSDSFVMTQAMQRLGAREVMTFYFGLDHLPEQTNAKEPWLVYANRGLEDIYAPSQVLNVFQALAQHAPQARLIVANDGALKASMFAQAQAMNLADKIQFTGRLTASQQQMWYQRAQWFISTPKSDSVSVSVLEAMASGCIPILSDLPANRELVRAGENGLIVKAESLCGKAIQQVFEKRADIARDNRAFIEQNALFAPSVAKLMTRLHEFGS